MTTHAQGVAMVLSATEPAQVIDSRGAEGKARPMVILEDGEVITTGEAGSASVVLFADSREYAVGGNSRIKVTADRLEKESGTLEVSRDQAKLTLPRHCALSSRRVMGEMLRDHRAAASHFVNPPNFGQIRDGSVVFRWRLAKPAETVSLAIYDPDDEEVLSAKVSGEELSFPPEGTEDLHPGASYFVEVYDPAVPSGSASSRAEAEFRVMTKAEVAEVEAGERRAAEIADSDPDDPVPLMELMVLYLHHRLYADAAATGERLQTMLPDNPELLRLQARSWAALGMTDRARQAEGLANTLSADK